MSPTSDDHPTLTQFTDPMCTWCWGSAPIIRRLKLTYGEQLRLEFVMGGLIEDFDEFYDSANDIAEPSEVGPHWKDASEMHGMPVKTDIFEVDPASSTYPASVAFVAARQQDRERGHRYLRRLREAYATQVRNVNHRDEQLEIAETIGLDVGEFTKALDDGTARAGFQADLERTREAGVRAFPTYQITGPQGERWIDGFQPFDTLAEALADVAPALDQRSLPPIEAFIAEYEPVATQEVAEVYELAPGRAQQTLQSLCDEGRLGRERRGNGLFWHTKSVGDA